MGKILILSAPSGSGKSTLVNYLMANWGREFNLEFSVSVTSRQPRGSEMHGVEYYFLTPEEFREKVANEEFLEYEEVYQNCFYGTLKSEIKRLMDKGANVIFDVDVVGGCNIKRFYGEQALSIFIQPPSVDELRQRLIKRGTDSAEVIESRVAKASYEISFAPQFDVVIINDDLEKAKIKLLKVVKDFLSE